MQSLHTVNKVPVTEGMLIKPWIADIPLWRSAITDTPLCMLPDHYANEQKNIDDAGIPINQYFKHVNCSPWTLLIKNKVTDRYVNLKILNDDMIKIKADVKVISTDRLLQHYNRLAAMYV